MLCVDVLQERSYLPTTGIKAMCTVKPHSTHYCGILHLIHDPEWQAVVSSALGPSISPLHTANPDPFTISASALASKLFFSRSVNSEQTSHRGPRLPELRKTGGKIKRNKQKMKKCQLPRGWASKCFHQVVSVSPSSPGSFYCIMPQTVM